jgi:hypothetical protein
MGDKDQETGGGRQDKQSRFPGFVVVDFQQGMLKALVMKAKLEEVGIPVFLDYESVGPIFGLTVDGLGEVRLLVPAERADEARALIDEPESPVEGELSGSGDAESEAG